MRLRDHGMERAAAAREIGASRTAGNNCARGYKTHRDGVVVGFVPALDRREVRQIGSRYVSQDNRVRNARIYSTRVRVRFACGW